MRGPHARLWRSLLRLELLATALGAAVLIAYADHAAVRAWPAAACLAALVLVQQIGGRLPASKTRIGWVDLRLLAVAIAVATLSRFADPLSTPLHLLVGWLGLAEAARPWSRVRALAIPGIPVLAVLPAAVLRPAWMPAVDPAALPQFAIGLALLLGMDTLALVVSRRASADARALTREQIRLRDRHRQERALLEAIDEPVLLLDAELHVVGANRDARAGFGDELEHRRLGELVRVPEGHESIPEPGALSAQGVYHAVEAYQASGSRRGQRWSLDLRRLPIEGEDRARWVAVLHRSASMLEQVEVEEQRYAALQSAGRRRAELLRLMSHELRSPLHALLGFTDLLREPESGGLSPEQQERLDAMRRTGRHLQGILDDVRHYVRLGERPPPRQTRFDLVGAVDDTVQMVVSSAERGELDLRVSAPPTAVAVLGDPQMTARALINLLTNAIRFTPPGGEVRVATRVHDDRAEVVVEDTGAGIAWIDQARVFEPFERGPHRDGADADGAGMGLSLARRLMELQGGTISLRSRPGHGSTFVLSLALADVAPAPLADPLGAEV